MALITSIDWKTKDDMILMAITIIIIGETIPADTAASPRTNPPKILIAVPLELGILVSLSLNISKDIIIIKDSTNDGKGTLDLCAIKLINKLIGIKLTL